MTTAIHNTPCHELARKIRDRETSAQAVATAFLDRLHSTEPSIKAYLHVAKDKALEQAESIDKQIAAGEKVGPLGGVPVGLKDMIITNDMPTSAGSRILEGWVAPYESTVAQKLREAGAIFLGKQNQDEFAMGSSTENSAFHPTHNPWDLDRVPGGSSGGSAASVAVGSSAASLGTDTGGSIRQPAAFCGVVGLKPTYGRVSRYGVVAYASSLDQVGPLCRDVRDAALFVEVLSGRDPKDSTTASISPPRLQKELGQSIKGLRVGIPKNFFADGLDVEIAESVNNAIKSFRDAGAHLVEIDLPNSSHSIPAYYFIAPAEASSNLSRYDGMRFGIRKGGPRAGLLETYEETRGQGFGPEVKRRIMLGTYCLRSGYYDAYYAKAQKVRTLIQADFRNAFEKVDVIASPVTPTSAFKIGEKVNEPLSMYLSDVFTIGVNLAGLPGISIPCGQTTNRLPIGLQLIGRAFDEATLIRFAHMAENASSFPSDCPEVL